MPDRLDIAGERATRPELADDELAADDWVFEQMDQIGMFNP